MVVITTMLYGATKVKNKMEDRAAIVAALRINMEQESSKTVEELRGYIFANLSGKAGDFASADFWHYTKLENARKILVGETPGFIVRSLEKMNDRDESNLYGEKSKSLYALCFCNSDKENIPMWYMYGGIDGKGVALGITPKRMMDFISSIDTVYGVCGKKVRKKAEFKRGVDFEIQAGWVVYRNQREPSNYRIKGKWFDKVDNSFTVDNYFIKLYPWEYEKEFRILLNFNHPIGYNRIYIPLGDLKVKVMLAPEFSKSENDKTRELPYECVLTEKRSGIEAIMDLSR